MEDFTEKLANKNNPGNLFKKPVIFGKRPGQTRGAFLKTLPLDICQQNLNENEPVPPVVLTPADATVTPVEDSIPPPVPENPTKDAPNHKEEPITTSDKKAPSRSPAELLKEKQIAPIPYKEPAWSGLCEQTYSLEVLKNGAIVGNEDIPKRPYWVFGRLANCHVVLEHPSISRHHAVLQYRHEPSEDGTKEKGWYLYDLGSTHGTFLNKNQCHPKTYCRLHVGHVFKFGGSTRLFVVHGPSEDEEIESEFTVTELIEQRRIRELELAQKEQEAENLRKIQEAEEERKREEQGVDWGMGEDANEETDTKENPFAEDVAGIHEELYLDDPKKTLRGWFEREGYEMEYIVEEKANGHFICRITLPVEGQTGVPLMAEASVKGKKKDAVVQCALEACRVLDRHGLLRKSQHEGREKKKRNYADDDYYSSDEDTFLDRTGSVEQKRLARMKAAGKADEGVETYETLMQKYEATQKQIAEANAELRIAVEKQKEFQANQNSEDVDALEAFMSSLKENVPDKKIVSQLKVRIATLNQEATRLRKLINMAKPASLPDLQTANTSPKVEPSPKASPMIGSLKNRTRLEFKAPPSEPHIMNEPSETQEEIENEEEEADVTKTSNEETKKTEMEVEANEKKDVNDRQKGTSEVTLPKDLSISAKPEASVPSKTVPEKWRVPADVVGAPPVTKSRILGPTLPPELLNSLKRETGGENIVEKKKLKRSKKNAIKAPQEEVLGDYDASDPAYALWLPPDDQKGDGKIDLNRKLGY